MRQGLSIPYPLIADKNFGKILDPSQTNGGKSSKICTQNVGNEFLAVLIFELLKKVRKIFLIRSKEIIILHKSETLISSK